MATRRLGEISAALDKSKGGQPYQKKSTRPADGRVETKTETLAAIGITRQRASEAEKIAAIPEAAFEAKIAETKAAAGDLSKSALLTLQENLQGLPDLCHTVQRALTYLQPYNEAEGLIYHRIKPRTRTC